MSPCTSSGAVAARGSSKDVGASGLLPVVFFATFGMNLLHSEPSSSCNLSDKVRQPQFVLGGKQPTYTQMGSCSALSLIYIH